MANIIPFRGLIYNLEKICDLSKVIAPPYDVISKEEQIAFHECSPHNVIRLILGLTTGEDSCDNNCHTRAASCFNQWLSEGILVQDNLPAIYLTSLEFLQDNKSVTRFGMILLVKLEPFSKGIILPHERTFSKVKSERFELMKVCHANFSPIFSLYSDQNGILKTLKTAISGKSPDTQATDDKGHIHKMWRITDTSVHKYVTDAMADKKIFIADGHHRYETALNYRDWIAAMTPDFSDAHPANYVMMYLSSMEDPGLVILPAHRMLTEIPESTRSEFIQKARNYFDILTIPLKKDSVGSSLRLEPTTTAEFLSNLKYDHSEHRIGVCMKNDPELHVLILKPGVMKQLFADELSESLRNLDVNVLTRLIFMEILGFDQERLDNEKVISYSSIAEKAIDAAISGKCDMAFIINPTRIEQVRAVAEEGLIMPRKSTYFYPKVITGQVMNSLQI